MVEAFVVADGPIARKNGSYESSILPFYHRQTYEWLEMQGSWNSNRCLCTRLRCLSTEVTSKPRYSPTSGYTVQALTWYFRLCVLLTAILSLLLVDVSRICVYLCDANIFISHHGDNKLITRFMIACCISQTWTTKTPSAPDNGVMESHCAICNADKSIR